MFDALNLRAETRDGAEQSCRALLRLLRLLRLHQEGFLHCWCWIFSQMSSSTANTVQPNGAAWLLIWVTWCPLCPFYLLYFLNGQIPSTEDASCPRRLPFRHFLSVWCDLTSSLWVFIRGVIGWCAVLFVRDTWPRVPPRWCPLSFVIFWSAEMIIIPPHASLITDAQRRGLTAQPLGDRAAPRCAGGGRSSVCSLTVLLTFSLSVHQESVTQCLVTWFTLNSIQTTKLKIWKETFYRPLNWYL